ncbi:MAG: ABC transporter permease [Chloroflexi bacterium]|nr:MAG: ABC transporter permease [Chloroflexota bacterium]
MIRITLRHLIRHRRLDLTILLCLALGSTILISLSGYESVISNQELHQALISASPAERSLLITGSSQTFDAILYEDIQNSLGTALKERVEIRHATLQVNPQFEADLPFNMIDVYSFDPLAGHIRLIQGKLPEPIRLYEVVGSAPPLIETMISKRVAEQTGYQVGDRITVSLYHRFKIVGIAELLDTNDDAWGGDLSAFQVTNETLPLIISRSSMRTHILRPIFLHQVSWRITLDHERIRSEQVGNLRLNLLNFEVQAGTKGAVLISGLIQILEDHQARLSPIHTAFFLLCLQSALILLFALAALAFTRDQSSQVELATFSARGASLWQMISPIALKAFIISMPAALICGTGLAQVLIRLWHRDINIVALYPFPGSTWLISAILAGAGWLVLTLPVLSTLNRESVRERLLQQPWIQRYSLDVYLFAFGSVLSWQLTQSGSLLTHQLENDSRFFDPVLIAGPPLMLAACIMLSIRLLPILARSIARVATHLQGSVLHLGFLRLTHNSQGAGWVLLVTGMVSAQVTLNLVFKDMLASNLSLMPAPSLGLGLSEAISLNSFILILFTCSLFFLLSLFTSQGRLEEFKVLRALGLPARQGRFALNIEFLPSLLLGVALGTILSLGLLWMLFTYLIQASGNIVIGQSVVDWGTLAQLDTLLLFTFGAALLLPLIRMPAQELWTTFQEAE